MTWSFQALNAPIQPPGLGKALRAAALQRRQQEKPITQASIELTKQREWLNLALKQGAISVSDYTAALNRLADQTRLLSQAMRRSLAKD